MGEKNSREMTQPKFTVSCFDNLKTTTRGKKRRRKDSQEVEGRIPPGGVKKRRWGRSSKERKSRNLAQKSQRTAKSIVFSQKKKANGENTTVQPKKNREGSGCQAQQKDCSQAVVTKIAELWRYTG